MNSYLFPEILTEEQETLVIIGNGFDLAHGIKSKYSHFKEWLIENNNDRLVSLLEIFFSNSRDVWSSLEETFGEYDVYSILDICKPDKEFDFDHSLSSSARVEDAPSAVFTPVLDEFKETFHDWVDQIDISNVHDILPLSPYSKYLSFNYTDTLETVYHIPNENVIHIHGYRKSNGEYIIGHNNLQDPHDAWDDSNWLFENNALEYVVDQMNGFAKDYPSNIKHYSTFFESLNDVKLIGIYGHSLGEIDWPYFEKIVSIVGANTPWKISYHQPDDIINIEKFKSHFCLSNVIPFKM